MEQITFTVMDHWSVESSAFLQIISEFEKLTGIQVRLRFMDWHTGRRELVQFALDRSGADVSEIGTTWLSELAALGVVRAFSPQDQADLGFPDEYLPLAVKSCKIADGDQVWAIPWITEAFALCYRRDLFRYAGINPDTFLQSMSSLTTAAERLKQMGVDIPIAVPDRKNPTLALQCLASWVWQNKSDFVITNGTHHSFNLAQTIEASVAFFSLIRSYTPYGMNLLDRDGIYAVFHQGYAAAGIGGLWLNRISPGYTIPEVEREISILRLPSATFTGGTNLVVWKHCLHERAALELVKYISSARIVRLTAANVNAIPSRWKAVANSKDFRTDAYYQYVQAVENGRSFPHIPLWGVLETMLSNAMVRIWESILADPQTDLYKLSGEILTQVDQQWNIRQARNI
jgi:multiple sugar transport system substrate-binding protein